MIYDITHTHFSVYFVNHMPSSHPAEFHLAKKDSETLDPIERRPCSSYLTHPVPQSSPVNPSRNPSTEPSALRIPRHGSPAPTLSSSFGQLVVVNRSVRRDGEVRPARSDGPTVRRLLVLCSLRTWCKTKTTAKALEATRCFGLAVLDGELAVRTSTCMWSMNRESHIYIYIYHTNPLRNPI